MARMGLFAVAALLLLVARCSQADFAAALGGLPVVGPMVQPSAPAPVYASAIGTPAAVVLPETDIAAWFDPAAKDPHDAATWRAAEAFLAAAGTKDGWTAACKKAGEAAGSDRAAKPEVGALACSKDGTVTALQGFAVHLLQAKAAVALYMKGAPNGTLPAIQARQAQVRLDCMAGAASRPGGPDSPLATACARALEAAYLTGGGAAATFDALGEAYALAAGEIARLAPAIDPEPGWFEAAK